MSDDAALLVEGALNMVVSDDYLEGVSLPTSNQALKALFIVWQNLSDGGAMPGWGPRSVQSWMVFISGSFRQLFKDWG